MPPAVYTAAAAVKHASSTLDTRRSEPRPRLLPSGMAVPQGLVVTALVLLAVVCACAALPQYGLGLAAQYSAGDFNPDTGNRFGAQPVQEPGVVGYDSEIPGARASFRAYHASQPGADGINSFDTLALKSQGGVY